MTSLRVDALLTLAGLVDGLGDSFEKVCRVAKAQGARPILFLDGDKRKQVEQARFGEAHPDVPVVLVPDGKEFEQVVDAEVYFRAVAEQAGGADGQVTAAAFAAWVPVHEAVLPESRKEGFRRMAFTKKVDRWLEELGLRDLNKPQAMRRSVEMVDTPGQVDTRLLMGRVAAGTH